MTKHELKETLKVGLNAGVYGKTFLFTNTTFKHKGGEFHKVKLILSEDEVVFASSNSVRIKYKDIDSVSISSDGKVRKIIFKCHNGTASVYECSDINNYSFSGDNSIYPKRFGVSDSREFLGCCMLCKDGKKVTRIGDSSPKDVTRYGEILQVKSDLGKWIGYVTRDNSGLIGIIQGKITPTRNIKVISVYENRALLEEELVYKTKGKVYTLTNYFRSPIPYTKED